MELIDRQALLEHLKIHCGGCGEALHCAFEAPTIDAVEVVHGRWVRMDAHKGMEQFKCSICLSECYVPTCMNEPMYDYCPNCGAKMDGERSEGE